MPSTTDALRRSPLDDRHRAAGAKLIGFAGWEMPVQYDGIKAEHLAVRSNAGLFDVSHMGQIETAGPGAQALLQHLLSNDLRRLPEGGAQYSVICTPEGGVLDDVFTYRLAETCFVTVTNAANHQRDLEWFQRHAPDFDADIIDRCDEFAMLAVQGPRARHLLHGLSDGPLPPRMHFGGRTIAGVPMLVCGTGYTGEPGVELLLDPDRAGEVWDALLAAGATPAGLGARDTLRLEVGYHLYGNDLDRDHGPIEAGLGWCCREATGFVGSDVVARVRAEGPA
ncbi:MAG TPA: glycine cleavage system aminomethyltransferase GcvT, partial [Solirubrobacteraceae bacterium]|nr:glycine cleavage system aminomethyltransferase GcvT [Solirubrobacteraceae bacterium]